MNFRAFMVVLLIACTAKAQVLPPVPEFKLEAIPAGEDKIVVAYEGKPAPFTGQLFDGATALRWANYLQQYKLQAPLVLETQKQLYLAELSYRDQVLVLERESSKKVQDDFMARLKSLEAKNAVLQAELAKGPPWYASRDFGIVLGVIGTAGLTALSIWALSQTNQ